MPDVLAFPEDHEGEKRTAKETPSDERVTTGQAEVKMWGQGIATCYNNSCGVPVLLFWTLEHFSDATFPLTDVGYKSRQNLAIVYTEMGELAKAEEQWRRITQEVPAYRDGWRHLGESMLARGDHEQATLLARKLQADDKLKTLGLVLEAQVATGWSDHLLAREILERAVTQGDCSRTQQQCDQEFLAGLRAACEEAERTGT